MKIVAISDTHNKLDQIKLPPGDLLIVSGDFTMAGELKELATFNHAIGHVKNMYKHGALVIPGNHELGCERNFGFVKGLLYNVNYFIHHEEIVIDGKRFFGSAYTPRFFDWEYNLDRGPAIKAKWDLIPYGIDVLITHGPVAGIHDINSKGESMGCQDLLDAVLRIKPKLHICGHNHSGYGIEAVRGVTFINASTCNEKYLPINAPIEIEI
jgi:Icc-related predicted phosphoesterase